MADWLKCQISPLVKYRQNQNQTTQPIHVPFYLNRKSGKWKLLKVQVCC